MQFLIEFVTDGLEQGDGYGFQLENPGLLGLANTNTITRLTVNVNDQFI